MKLPKDIREKLYTGKVTMFAWPENGVSLERDKVLRLETGARSAAEVSFRIISWEEVEGETMVAARIVDDPIRLLPKLAGDYVDSPSRAAWFSGEPELEAVDSDSQRRFSRAALMARNDEFGELISAMDEVKVALDTKVRERPELRRYVGHEITKINNHIAAARRQLGQRKAA
jgi:hypothetical protein